MLYVLIALLLSPLLLRKPSQQEIKKILVIQSAKIGDFVCTTPLINSIRQAFPNARTTVLVSPVVSDLAKELPFIDDIISCQSKTTKGFLGKLKWVKKVRQHNFDCVFCCNGGVAWPTILSLAGIPVRVGVTPNFAGKSTRLAQKLWTRSIAHDGNRLIGETYADMLRAIGVNHFTYQKIIASNKNAENKIQAFLKKNENDIFYIGLAISAANPLKSLEPALLADICTGIFLKFDNANIVFIGTAQDQDQVLSIQNQLQNEHTGRIINTCGQFSIGEISALLSKLSLFIGVDSGLTYMADALDIPLISIAGPCNMKETRPVGNKATIIQLDLPCCPCAHIFRAPYSCKIGTRACIKNVSAQQILSIIQEKSVETKSLNT